MSRFTKKVKQTDTDMVIAEVFDVSGERVGLQFFRWPPFNQEKRLKRAHAWAERWIANCEKYVTGGAQ